MTFMTAMALCLYGPHALYVYCSLSRALSLSLSQPKITQQMALLDGQARKTVFGKRSKLTKFTVWQQQAASKQQASRDSGTDIDPFGAIHIQGCRQDLIQNTTISSISSTPLEPFTYKDVVKTSFQI